MKGSYVNEYLTLRHTAEKWGCVYEPLHRLIVYNDDSERVYIHDNFDTHLRHSLDEKRPFIGIITIYCPKQKKSDVWHANAFYFAPQTTRGGRFYRFDPNGSVLHYDPQQLDRVLKHELKKFGVMYVPPSKTCTVPGPQQFELNSRLGYCQTWCFVYLERVLSGQLDPKNPCTSLLENPKQIPHLIAGEYRKQLKNVYSMMRQAYDYYLDVKEMQSQDLDMFRNEYV